jgi:hypothetical protein
MDAVPEVEVSQDSQDVLNSPSVQHSILDGVQAVDRDFHCFQLQGCEFLQVAAKVLQVAVDADLIDLGSNGDQGRSPSIDVLPQ